MRRSTVIAAAAAALLGLSLAPAVASAAPGPAPGARAGDAVPARTGDAVLPAGGELAHPSISDPGAGALPTDAYYRVSGPNRYATAVEVSRTMICDGAEILCECPPEQPDCTILGDAAHPVELAFIASGTNYPDALGAGPIAFGIGPLLLVPPTGTVPQVVLDELDRITPSGLVVFGGTSAVSDAVVDQLKTHTTDGQVQRISGPNRYATAALGAIQNDAWWRAVDANNDNVPDNIGLDTIVLASGESYADALAGGGAAANSRGSLLLTTRTKLPDVTKSALQSIDPKTVIITGGTSTVSDAVLAQVQAALPSSKVERASGSNRFDTAIDVSSKVFDTSATAVFVVYAYNYPDALAAAPFAGVIGASTLLSATPCVTANTRDEASRLNPAEVYGFGGESTLADNAILMGVC